MVWRNPLSLKLIPTDDPLSFSSMGADETGLPVGQHPGAFGVQRKYHCHEGVDLYAPIGAVVSAVEAGVVVAVIPFTGPHAGPTLAHWLDTWAVFVEGPSGVVVYGEIEPGVVEGQQVAVGERIGQVVRVLRNDKGRPVSMLHLELHEAGSRKAPEWLESAKRPSVLRDPTPYLLEASQGC